MKPPWYLYRPHKNICINHIGYKPTNNLENSFSSYLSLIILEGMRAQGLLSSILYNILTKESRSTKSLTKHR